jgi:hypothetical protein
MLPIHTLTFTLLTLTPVALSAAVGWCKPSANQIGQAGGVYMCSGPKFDGACKWHSPSEMANCYTWKGPTAGSIGPDPGGVCYLYPSNDCSGLPVGANTAENS